LKLSDYIPKHPHYIKTN